MKWNISSDRYKFLEGAAFSTGSYLRVYIVCHVTSALRLYMTLQSFVNSDIRRRGLDGPQLNLPSQRVMCALIKGIPHLRSDNQVGNNAIPVLQHGIRGEQVGQPAVILTALAWTCIVCWIWKNRQTRKRKTCDEQNPFKQSVTYFALKCGGKELHPNRKQIKNSMQYIFTIFQWSPLPHPLNDRKIKRREVANQMHLRNMTFW